MSLGVFNTIFFYFGGFEGRIFLPIPVSGWFETFWQIMGLKFFQDIFFQGRLRSPNKAFMDGPH